MAHDSIGSCYARKDFNVSMASRTFGSRPIPPALRCAKEDGLGHPGVPGLSHVLGDARDRFVFMANVSFPDALFEVGEVQQIAKSLGIEISSLSWNDAHFETLARLMVS
jgi:hypothetical protein